MDYQTMRTFADSWGLLFMVLVFTGVVLSVFFWPGAKRSAQEAAQIPLKED
ncbi:MAG: cbb3-type cytochrome c oxidase subunit 3 [Notoacmeibacter sp.]|nr:cbb3-type cytochrome c oxidase subunit 3 [Notoacmeibacter sp.]